MAKAERTCSWVHVSTTAVLTFLKLVEKLLSRVGKIVAVDISKRTVVLSETLVLQMTAPLLKDKDGLSYRQRTCQSKEHSVPDTLIISFLSLCLIHH